MAWTNSNIFDKNIFVLYVQSSGSRETRHGNSQHFKIFPKKFSFMAFLLNFVRSKVNISKTRFLIFFDSRQISKKKESILTFVPIGKSYSLYECIFFKYSCNFVEIVFIHFNDNPIRCTHLHESETKAN